MLRNRLTRILVLFALLSGFGVIQAGPRSQTRGARGAERAEMSASQVMARGGGLVAIAWDRLELLLRLASEAAAESSDDDYSSNGITDEPDPTTLTITSGSEESDEEEDEEEEPSDPVDPTSLTLPKWNGAD